MEKLDPLPTVPTMMNWRTQHAPARLANGTLIPSLIGTWLKLQGINGTTKITERHDPDL